MNYFIDLALKGQGYTVYDFFNADRYLQRNSIIETEDGVQISSDKDGFVDIYSQPSKEYGGIRDNEGADMLQYIRDESSGFSCFTISFSNTFGADFLIEAIEVIYQNFKTKECYIMEEVTDRVYSLEEFYTEFGVKSFFWL